MNARAALLAAIFVVGCDRHPSLPICIPYPPPGVYKARTWAELGTRFPEQWVICRPARAEQADELTVWISQSGDR